MLGPTTAAEYEASDRGTLYVSACLLVQASKVWSQLYMTWFGASTKLRARIPRHFSKPFFLPVRAYPQVVGSRWAAIVPLTFALLVLFMSAYPNYTDAARISLFLCV